MTQTRGIRNNNPGNIRNSERNDWMGEVEKCNKEDTAFEEFETIEHGVRAMMKLLRKYQRSYGAKTLQEIIERWAPRCENHTDNYINMVARRMQVPTCAPLDLDNRGTMCALVEAMCFVENGIFIPMATIEGGWDLM